MNYEESARKVSEVLGIEIIDNDFGCCGFPIEAINETKALSMAAMNLKKASESNEPLLTLCSACGEMLSKAEQLLENEVVTKEVNKLLQKNLGTSYNGEKPRVLHFVRMLYEDYGIDKLRENISNPLTGIKIATHPGCHYVRPKELFQGFDDALFPKSLDELVEVTGAELVDYIGKTDCCGGSILAVSESIAKVMTMKKLETLFGTVDALVLICPFCSIMYDKYQKLLGEELEKEYNIPVLYYPQLLGLALGQKPEDLGFDVNSVSVDELLERVLQ
jgi:heterodisulfide reductase subunit B